MDRCLTSRKERNDKYLTAKKGQKAQISYLKERTERTNILPQRKDRKSKYLTSKKGEKGQISYLTERQKEQISYLKERTERTKKAGKVPSLQ